MSRADAAIVQVCREGCVQTYAFSQGDRGGLARAVRADEATMIAEVTTAAEVPAALASGVDARRRSSPLALMAVMSAGAIIGPRELVIAIVAKAEAMIARLAG